MKRLISLCLVVLLVFSFVLPVKARADGVDWVELLETQTVNDSGVNWFSYTTSTTIEVPLPHRTRVTKIDALISYTYGTLPSKVEMAVGSSWVVLNVTEIDTGVARIYGEIGNTFFDSIKLRFTRTATTTSTVELMSLRYYALPFVTDSASGNIVLETQMGTQSVVVGNYVYVDTDTDGTSRGYKYTLTASFGKPYLYDTLTISGLIDYGSIDSIRVMYGDVAVPYDINLIEVDAHSEWWETGYAVYQYGDYYFCLTIDVSNIDRSTKNTCVVEINGGHNSVVGIGVEITDFNGSVYVADTTDASNWNRFKSFMTGLFDDLATQLAPDFSDLGTWISEQTTTLNTALTNLRTSVNTGFSNVSTWITNQTNTLKTAMNTGFTNIGTWITNQTNTLKTQLVGIWQEVEEGFSNVGTWISDHTDALVSKLTSFESSVSHGIAHVIAQFEVYFGVKDQDAIDDLGENSDSISQGASDIHDFEQSQQDTLDSGFATIQSAVTFTNFAAALVFVQKYANMTISGISDYTIVFTLPLFLGLFFYLCSRIPGVTRWKSRPPKSKGGGSP